MPGLHGRGGKREPGPGKSLGRPKTGVAKKVARIPADWDMANVEEKVAGFDAAKREVADLRNALERANYSLKEKDEELKNVHAELEAVKRERDELRAHLQSTRTASITTATPPVLQAEWPEVSDEVITVCREQGLTAHKASQIHAKRGKGDATLFRYMRSFQ